MGKNLAMAREGSQVSMDGVDLSWPLGGERQVIKQPENLSYRLRERILAGTIVETDDAVTKPAPGLDEGQRRLMTGDEAREYREIPAGPVTRLQFVREKGEAVQVPVMRAIDPSTPAPDDSPADTEEQPKRTRKSPSTRRKSSGAKARTGNRAPTPRPAAEAPTPREPQASDTPSEARDAREEATAAQLEQASE
jgi:hypothetical protein